MNDESIQRRVVGSSICYWMTEALAHESGRQKIRLRVWQQQGRRRPQLGVWQRPELPAVAVMAPQQGVWPRPQQGAWQRPQMGVWQRPQLVLSSGSRLR